MENMHIHTFVDKYNFPQQNSYAKYSSVPMYNENLLFNKTRALTKQRYMYIPR